MSQPSSRSNHRQVRLRLSAAMLHRTQQLGIDPRQPCQRLRIQPIVFLPALSDQPHIARMRHNHFVPQLAQQRLTQGECIPVSSAMRLRGMLPNASPNAFAVVLTRCSRTMRPLSSSMPVPAGSIAQVQSDGQFLL